MKWIPTDLRLPYISLRPIRYATFDATFDLTDYTCRMTVIFGTLKNDSLLIDSLAQTVISVTETSSKMSSGQCFERWIIFVKMFKISVWLAYSILLDVDS